MGLQQIRDTLQRHGLRLSRELGQSFLIEDVMADRLALASGASAGDAIIEVGTGLGILTRALAQRAETVATIEIDSGLVAALRADAALPTNVTLIHADALDLDLGALAEELAGRAGRRTVRLVANLPYAVATPLLRRLLDLRELLADWSVMLQRELALRLVAEPGTRDYSSLTVLHRLAVDVSWEVDLKAGCFFPPPKVASTFVRLRPQQRTSLAPGELARAERVIRAVFGKRRKTILNGLRGGGLPQSGDRVALSAALAEAGIEPGVRAETLGAETLLRLARALQ